MEGNVDFVEKPEETSIPGKLAIWLESLTPILEDVSWNPLRKHELGALIKKKIKFSSYIRKFRVEQL